MRRNRRQKCPSRTRIRARTVSSSRARIARTSRHSEAEPVCTELPEPAGQTTMTTVDAAAADNHLTAETRLSGPDSTVFPVKTSSEPTAMHKSKQDSVLFSGNAVLFLVLYFYNAVLYL